MNMRKGNIQNLFDIREIRRDILCLRSPQAQKHQRLFMAVLQVHPVNFPLMAESEQDVLLSGFRRYLAGLSDKETLLIHARTRPYDLEPYMQTLEDAPPEYQEMAEDHRRFVQDLARRRAALTREFFLRIPVTIDAALSRSLSPDQIFALVQTELNQSVEHHMRGLDHTGLSSTRLVGQQLVQYVASCSHAHNAIAYPSPPFEEMDEESEETLSSEEDEEQEVEETHETRWVWQSSLTLARRASKARRQAQREGNVPPVVLSLPEILQPAAVESRPDFVKIQHNAGTEYIRSRVVVRYPTEVAAGWLDEVLDLDEPFVEILLFLRTLDADTYVRNLTRKISGYRATQLIEERQGRTENPYIGVARERTEDLRDDLVRRREAVHACSMYIAVRAQDHKTLDRRDQKVAQALKRLEVQSVPLQYQHLEGWLLLLNGREILHRHRPLDTSTIVALFPFLSSNISTEPGILFGLSSGGGLIILNPASSQLDNGHIAAFSRSGSGKSFFWKIVTNRAVLVGWNVTVIDPEDEYRKLSAKYNGNSITMNAGAFQINPFAIPAGAAPEGRNVLEGHIHFLLLLMDLLLADEQPGTLTMKEKGFLTRCFTHLYTEHGITPNPSTHAFKPPSMQEFYHLLLEEQDPYEMADRLAPYVHAFPAETSVRLDNRLTIFHIRDLPTQLRRVGLFLGLQFVWWQARKDLLPQKRLVVIDEAWMLLAYPNVGRELEELSRRGRKYGFCLFMTTQNAEDVLANESGRTIVLNCAMKVLMKQDSTTINVLSQAFRLTQEEEHHLLTSEKGEGLLFARASHVPLRVVASDQENLFATTDINDQTAIQQAQFAEVVEQGEGPAQEREP